jgi:hypothetical protein
MDKLELIINHFVLAVRLVNHPSPFSSCGIECRAQILHTMEMRLELNDTSQIICACVYRKKEEACGGRKDSASSINHQQRVLSSFCQLTKWHGGALPLNANSE